MVGIAALASKGNAQSFPPVWNATTSYQTGDIVHYLDGNSYKSIANQTTIHPNPAKSGAKSFWEVYDVDSKQLNITIGAGQQFGSLVDAWVYLRDARISQNCSVNLNIVNADNVHNYAENVVGSFSLNHPYGSAISINGPNYGTAIFYFNGTPGFDLTAGHSFGMLNKLSVVSTGAPPSGTVGIRVLDNSHLLVSNMSISHFPTGLYAGGCSSATVTGNLSVVNFGHIGILSDLGSTIVIQKPIALDGGHSAEWGYYCAKNSTLFAGGCKAANLATGFMAENGGYLEAGGSSAVGCQVGYFATLNGQIHADSSADSRGLASGISFYANGRAYIYCPGSTSLGRASGNDFKVLDGGWITH